MVAGQLSSVIRYVRRLAGTPAEFEDGDGQLLQRFAMLGDSAAFDALLGRHGSMVWGVCRRLLGDDHDAEDAFQATFLVLVRNARSISKQDSAGSWLYGVAYRTALKARAEAARRRSRERQGTVMSGSDPFLDADWRDLRPVIDQELNRLPEKYRAPIVLCYLEGKTNEEAAQQLGWTKGTVSGRLARARDMLRTRLTRQGVTLSVSTFVAALSCNSAQAAVPVGLIQSTKVAALACAAGKAVTAGAISASVSALAEGVMKAMFVTKLKIAAAVLFAAGLIGTGGVLSYGLGTPSSTGTADDDKSEARQDQDAPRKKAIGDQAKIQGTWLVVGGERNGKKADDAEAEQVKKLKFIFSGDKLFIKEGEGAREARFTLHPDKDPKVIKITPLDGPKKDQIANGLYSLTADKLKLCVNNGPDEEEPTEFKTKPGTGLAILELRREGDKDAEPAPKNAAPLLSATKLRSQNNLKQLALAMHNYHDATGALPPAAVFDEDGKALLSWLVLILPYIEQDALFRQFHLDEPWDSSHNKPLLAQMPPVYKSGGKTTPPNSTHCQVFTGVGTVFEGTKGSKLTDIPDGTSNTLLVVEAAEAVPWTKPDDVPYSAHKKIPELGGVFEDGFNAVMCDGSARFLKKSLKVDTLRAFITRHGGEVIDPKELGR